MFSVCIDRETGSCQTQYVIWYSIHILLISSSSILKWRSKSKNATRSLLVFLHSEGIAETSMAFCSMLNKLRLCAVLHDSIQLGGAERPRKQTSVFLHTLHQRHKRCSPRGTCLQSDGAQGFSLGARYWFETPSAAKRMDSYWLEVWRARRCQLGEMTAVATLPHPRRAHWRRPKTFSPDRIAHSPKPPGSEHWESSICTLHRHLEKDVNYRRDKLLFVLCLSALSFALAQLKFAAFCDILYLTFFSCEWSHLL